MIIRFISCAIMLVSKLSLVLGLTRLDIVDPNREFSNHVCGHFILDSFVTLEFLSYICILIAIIRPFFMCYVVVLT